MEPASKFKVQRTKDSVRQIAYDYFDGLKLTDVQASYLTRFSEQQMHDELKRIQEARNAR